MIVDLEENISSSRMHNKEHMEGKWIEKKFGISFTLFQTEDFPLVQFIKMYKIYSDCHISVSS